MDDVIICALMKVNANIFMTTLVHDWLLNQYKSADNFHIVVNEKKINNECDMRCVWGIISVRDKSIRMRRKVYIIDH